MIAFEAVVDAVQIAADREAAAGAAVRQHRRRRHEPQPGDIIVDPLGVVGVVGISGGDAGEQVLVAFAGKQIAVLQRVLAELGQERVAAVIGLDFERAAHGPPSSWTRWSKRRRSVLLSRSKNPSRFPVLPRPSREPFVLQLFELGAMAGILASFRRSTGLFHPRPLWKSGTSEPVTGI